MRKADKFLLCILGFCLLFGAMFIHASLRTAANLPWLRQEVEVVRSLGITDLCLFTEGSYTRHPSQSDRHAPFQSHPMALEFFPSGAIVMPPK